MYDSAMPSTAHQWLVVWLSRRIARDGYSLVGVDAGRFAQLLTPPPPPGISIGPVRPDVVGVHSRERFLALGEAKSAFDLDTSHTRVQLAAMLCMRDIQGRRARVYLAFPRAALEAAARTVVSLGLAPAARVILVPIADGALLA